MSSRLYLGSFCFNFWQKVFLLLTVSVSYQHVSHEYGKLLPFIVTKVGSIK